MPSPTAATAATYAPLQVHVCGAVEQPAVYELPAGSILQDAINAAGGVTSEADLARVNLAFELADHQQVYIPRQGESDPPPPVSGGETSQTLVNINTSSAGELETLPRIGPTTAQAILEHREAHGPFERIEDIQDVSGIGPATFETLKDLITVR
jgi:competence protein ComEA